MARHGVAAEGKILRAWRAIEKKRVRLKKRRVEAKKQKRRFEEQTERVKKAGIRWV